MWCSATANRTTLRRVAAFRLRTF
uniref:Uncharacterized protein n=1 Tax=Arundo donax TaxID=35708 RepID=A0A0A8ZSR8_ARUDO